MKQLIVVTDMEGCSGIFERNYEEFVHGSIEWNLKGRSKLTSDVLAVCEAAKESGINEILIYDGHYAGSSEYNIWFEKLPEITKPIITNNREYDWKKIREQAQEKPFGIITVGQHARAFTQDAYFPHTIQTPPIQEIYVNNKSIAELGMAVFAFAGVKYLCNIGDAASFKEARELSKKVTCISVKDKKMNYEPTPEETFNLIKSGVKEAIKSRFFKGKLKKQKYYKFKIILSEGYFVKDLYGVSSFKTEIKNNGKIFEYKIDSYYEGIEIFSMIKSQAVKL